MAFVGNYAYLINGKQIECDRNFLCIVMFCLRCLQTQRNLGWKMKRELSCLQTKEERRGAKRETLEEITLLTVHQRKGATWEPYCFALSVWSHSCFSSLALSHCFRILRISFPDTTVYFPFFNGTSYLELQSLTSLLQSDMPGASSSSSSSSPAGESTVTLYLTVKTRASDAIILYGKY